MINCEDPVILSGVFPCGKCPACLSLKRRTWAHRIIMESKAHAGNVSFVTLTYAEEKVPRTLSAIPTLQAWHLRDWLKRFRRAMEPVRVRHFAVGEYGDRSGRPHYHVALFGPRPCLGGPVTVSFKNGKASLTCQCHTCSVVRQTWGFGHIMVAGLSEKSAMYIAGYVVKKMTHSLDPRLNGRDPEFARMSLKPGLGALALDPVVSVLEKYQLPVPCGLRNGEKIMPMGRYIRRKIAKAVSDGSPEGIAAALDTRRALTKNMEAVSVLRAYSWASSQRPVDVLKQISPKYNPPPAKERSL